MSWARQGADFGELVTFMPIKAWTPVATQSSATVVDVSLEQVDPTKTGALTFAPEQLKKDMESSAHFHQRKLTSEEYDKYLEALKTTKNELGQDLYKYELAALARALKENFHKFAPDVTLDAIIETRFMEASELDPVFRDRYLETVEKYRGKFNTAPLIKTMVEPDSKDPYDAPKKADKYIHPMLRYGLVKRK